MSFCSLCRVEGTPEHMKSGWHTFNQRMLSEGKVPQSKELYDRFEKDKHEKGGAAAQASSQPPLVKQQSAAQKKNVNAWHWEEKDCTKFAKERITALLKAVEVPFAKGVVRIKEVKELEGDASLWNRKGKKFIGFEMKCTVEWEGEIKGESGPVHTAKGKAMLPEISADSDPDEYQVVNITVEGGTDHDDLCRRVFSKHGPPAINKALATFATELRAKLKEDQ